MEESSSVPQVIPPTQACASTSDRTTIKQANDIITAENPLELIKKAEVDLVRLLKNLDRIALTAKIVAKDRDGEPIELGEDNKAQITATVAIFELAKVIKDKSTAVQVGIFNDPNIVNEANRVLALRNKI